ncbi:hypothetical protein M2171_005400 [Bradyrhizobium japonicum USDA 38]|uniref:hypothetical protein n=1 Tax=Bradyrhizobium japonicum TaxID=375 RepID=UPI0004267B59|nr:hypothetical protein [Bradyrhizobium japonicum]MCS3896267.1 hypothetical protein [Bradyrhizobium japonicum USDA 38]MCS3948781.1 hypothetical protein [Bradyrhizobium japonicum]
MANDWAIAATGVTLSARINDRYPRSEFGTLHVQLYQMAVFGSPTRNGFSIFLYGVSVYGSIRNMTYRRSPDGRRFRPSLPAPGSASGSARLASSRWSSRLGGGDIA